MMKPTTTLAVNLRVTGCPNRCLHCWANGGPTKADMPLAAVVHVLDELEEITTVIPHVHLFLLDEPSYHPEFPAVVGEMGRRSLWGDNSFLATNGHGLSPYDEGTWETLKESGLSHLQFTFYGLAETHDRFARRQGAWANLAGAARAANDAGIDWAAAVLVHSGNLDEVEQAREFIGNLHPMARPAGAFLPSSQGRTDAGIRPDCRTMRIPECVPAVFRPEGEIVREILDEPGAACQPAVEKHPDLVVLEITNSLNVYISGGCDSGGLLAADPGMLSDGLGLGNLEQTPLLRMLDQYIVEPPWPVTALSGVSRAELAERYGDPDGTLLYHPQDLVLHRWGVAFLRERISHLRKDG